MKNHFYTKEYWINKGLSEKDAIQMVEIKKKETSCRCKEFWLKKGLSEKEAINKISDLQKNCTLKRTKDSYNDMLNPYQEEYWVKRNYKKEEIQIKIQEQKIKTNPYLSLSKDKIDSMINNRKKTYYNKSGIELSQINKKRGRTKEDLISQYGEEKAHDMVKNRGRRNKEFKRYSKISKLFFDSLQNMTEEHLFYSENEKWLRINENKGYFVDLIKDLKIIEFNGDFFHANPNLYKKDDVIKMSESKKLTAQEIWNQDNKKLNNLLNLGYDVLVVWESDVKKDKEKILNECLEFLKN